jgi:hypothetical protein
MLAGESREHVLRFWTRCVEPLFGLPERAYAALHTKSEPEVRRRCAARPAAPAGRRPGCSRQRAAAPAPEPAGRPAAQGVGATHASGPLAVTGFWGRRPRCAPRAPPLLSPLRPGRALPRSCMEHFPRRRQLAPRPPAPPQVRHDAPSTSSDQEEATAPAKDDGDATRWGGGCAGAATAGCGANHGGTCKISSGCGGSCCDAAPPARGPAGSGRPPTGPGCLSRSEGGGRAAEPRESPLTLPPRPPPRAAPARPPATAPPRAPPPSRAPRPSRRAAAASWRRC